mmetsp:Transcript_61361/g.170145  ORF Transcript_61361/g.170145 Transcript_61361/m.170145 type:complete len:493 (+) Transcript_61361:254-1732(+)
MASRTSHTAENSLSTGRDCKRAASEDKSTRSETSARSAPCKLSRTAGCPLLTTEGTGGRDGGGGRALGAGGAKPARLTRAIYAGSRFWGALAPVPALSAAQATMSSATSSCGFSAATAFDGSATGAAGTATRAAVDPCVAPTSGASEAVGAGGSGAAVVIGATSATTGTAGTARATGTVDAAGAGCAACAPTTGGIEGNLPLAAGSCVGLGGSCMCFVGVGGSGSAGVEAFGAAEWLPAVPSTSAEPFFWTRTPRGCDAISSSMASHASALAETCGQPLCIASSSSRADQAVSATGPGDCPALVVGASSSSSLDSTSTPWRPPSNSAGIDAESSACAKALDCRSLSATQPTNITQEQGFSHVDTPVVMQAKYEAPVAGSKCGPVQVALTPAKSERASSITARTQPGVSATTSGRWREWTTASAICTKCVKLGGVSETQPLASQAYRGVSPGATLLFRQPGGNGAWQKHSASQPTSGQAVSTASTSASCSHRW